MEDFIEKIKKQGNPYKIFDLDPQSDTKQIKDQYKLLTLKYHPDKNKNKSEAVLKEQNEIFQKVMTASKILFDPAQKAKLDDYMVGLKEQQARYFEQTKERRGYAEDLLVREKYAEELRREEQIKIQQEEQKRRNDILRQERERVEEQQRIIKEKQDQMKKDMENSKFWSDINSIKIKWSKKNKTSYSKALLNVIFSEYGRIKHIEVFAEKRMAFIEFLTTVAADQAVKENKIKDQDSSEEDLPTNLVINDKLIVKYFLKNKKRQEYLDMLQNKKGKKEDTYELNSINLDKIQNIANRSSRFVGVGVDDMIKRQRERKNMMKNMADED